MQLIAVLRRRTEAFAESDFTARLDAEAQRIRELYAQGFIRGAWSREDTPGACLLLEADSASEAEAELRSLPLVGAEMAEVQIIPLRGYRGFCS